MAQALAFQRSTSQVVTFDTISNIVAPLGPALSSVATTSGTFPAKTQNSNSIYQGNPYAMVATNTGNIEVRVYNTGTNTWSLSSPSFSPITFGAVQAPICLQTVNGILVAVWIESAAANSRVSVATYNGVAWSTRQNTATSANLNGSYGGNSVVWDSAVFFATANGICSYVPGTGFSPFDQGFNTAIASPLVDPITPQGCFAFWNDTLYFIKPITSITAAIIFSLSQTWNYSLTPPQWTTVTGVSGLVNAGVMLSGNDLGNYCMFVNKKNQLSVFQSGPSGTNLAVASPGSFPVFTDVTSNLLPSSIATAPNLGIDLYTDDRRRLNELQWFFIRNPALGGQTILTSWDGVNPVNIQTSYPESDYLLPASQDGEPYTVTGQQPACFIDTVVSGPNVTMTLASATGFNVGDNVQSNSPAISGIAQKFVVTMNLASATNFNIGDSIQSGSPAIAGTVLSVVGTTLTALVTAGVWPSSGNVTDNTTVTTTTFTAGTTALTAQVTAGTWLASGNITDTFTSTTTTYSGAVSAYVAPAFPGRAVIDYTIIDSLSRNCDVSGEYSLDGGVTWVAMTEGDGDDGATGLASSPSGTTHTFYWDAFADLNGSYPSLFLRMNARISVSVNEAPPTPFVAIIQEGYLQPPVTRNVSQDSFTLTAGSLHGVVITLASVVNFNVGNTVSAGGALGTITAVSGSAITVNETSGTFPTSGSITDTTTSTTTTILSTVCFYVGETVTGSVSGATGLVQYVSLTHVTVTTVVGTFLIGENITGSNVPLHRGQLSAIATNVVTTTVLPPDESTDLIEFWEAISTVTRGHAQFMFQGRLSTNQTRIQKLTMTLRASAPTENAQIKIFMSGFGAANQYTGPYSTFTTIPTADTQVIIDQTQLLNQPSATGKLYAVLVEFDLDSGANAVVSTPFFRHE